MSNNNSNQNSATNSFSFPLNPVYQQNIGRPTQSHTRPSYRNPNPNHPGGQGQQHNSTGYQNRGPRPPYQPRVQPQGGAYGQPQQSYNQAPGAPQQYNQNYRQVPPAAGYQQPYQQPQPGQYPQTGYQGQKPAIGYQGGYQNQAQPQPAYGQQQQPYQQQQGYQPRSNFNNRNQGSQGGDQYQNRPNSNYNQGATSFNNQGADKSQYQANRPAREYTEEQKQERKRQNLREKKLKHTFGGNSFAQNFLFSKKNNDALVSAANSYAQQLISDQQKQIIGEDALTITGASAMIGPQPSPQQVTNNNYQVNFYQGAPQYQGYQAPSYSGYGPQANPASINDASQIKSQTDTAIVKPSGAPPSGIDDKQQQDLSYLQDTFNQLQPPADRRRQNYQSGPGQGMIGPPGAQPHGYRPQYGYNQGGPQQPYQQNRYGNNPNYRGRGGMNNNRGGRFMQNNRYGQRGGYNNRFQQNRYNNQHQNQHDPNNSANKDDNIEDQDYDENILIQSNQIYEDEFDTVQKQQQSNVQPQNSNQQGKNSQNKPEKKAQKQLDPEEEEDLKKWIDQRRKKFPTKNRLEQQQARQDVGITNPDGSALDQTNAISAVRSNLEKKVELSKIEIKLRRKLTLINGQLSEKGGLKFLKNRSFQIMGNNRGSQQKPQQQRLKRPHVKRIHDDNDANKADGNEVNNEEIKFDENGMPILPEKRDDTHGQGMRRREGKLSLKDKKKRRKLRIQGQQQQNQIQTLDGKVPDETQEKKQVQFSEQIDTTIIPNNSENQQQSTTPGNQYGEDQDVNMNHSANKIFKYRQNFLQQELLQQEMHNEKMILLQCFRYFVKNDIV
eukprot:403375364